jgi:hypothetical protein
MNQAKALKIQQLSDSKKIQQNISQNPNFQNWFWNLSSTSGLSQK